MYALTGVIEQNKAVGIGAVHLLGLSEVSVAEARKSQFQGWRPAAWYRDRKSVV